MYSHVRSINYIGLLVGILLFLSSCATTPNTEEEGHDITIRDLEQIQETADILFNEETKVDIEKTSTGKYNVRVTIENTVGGYCEKHLDDTYLFFSSIKSTFATQLENIVVIHNYPDPYITGSDKAEERADVIRIGFKGTTLQKITWLEPVESVGMGKGKFLDFYHKYADTVYTHQFCENN